MTYKTITILMIATAVVLGSTITTVYAEEPLETKTLAEICEKKTSNEKYGFFDALCEYIVTLPMELEKINEDIQFLADDLELQISDLSTTIQSELSNFDTRITDVESTTSSLNEKVTVLDTRVSDVSTQVTTKINDMESSVSNAHTRISDVSAELNSRIDDVEIKGYGVVPVVDYQITDEWKSAGDNTTIRPILNCDKRCFSNNVLLSSGIYQIDSQSPYVVISESTSEDLKIRSFTIFVEDKVSQFGVSGNCGHYELVK